MVANFPTPSVVTSDPIPMGDSDRLTCHLNVNAIFNGTIVYQCEGSNDGVNFAPTGPTDNANAPGLKPLAAQVYPVAFIRFVFTLNATAAGITAAMFDLHVLTDHS
jgi:hypothetical protein